MSNNLITVNNLSVGNNLTVNSNILGSGSIQMTGSIQGSNVVSTGNISGSNINFTGNLNSITQQTLSYLDPTSSIQTQLNTNSTNTASNTTNIALNTANIASNTTNIASNTTNIASNTTSINTLNTTVTNILNSSNSTTQALATAITTNTNNIATNTANIATITANTATNTTAITLLKCDLFNFILSLSGDSVIRYCLLNTTTSYGILKIVATNGTPNTGLSFYNLGVHRININFKEGSLNGVSGDVYTLDITCLHLNTMTNLTKCLGMVGTGWCQNFAPGTWNTVGFINNQIQYLSMSVGATGIATSPYPNAGAFSFYINNTSLTDVWVIASRQNQIGIISNMCNCSVEFIG